MPQTAPPPCPLRPIVMLPLLLTAIFSILSRQCRGAPEDLVRCVHMYRNDEMRERLEGGEDPNDADGNGTLPLALACRYGRSRLVSLLLYHGARANDCYLDGVSCLAHSVQYGHTDVTRLLLTTGMDPDTPDTNGDTAIMHAASLNRATSLEMLVQHGASTRVYNCEGKSLLRLAAEKGNFDMAMKLVQIYGQCPYETCQFDGLNAISAAKSKGYKHLAAALECYSSFMSMSCAELDSDSLFSTGLISDVRTGIRESLAEEFEMERYSHFQSTRCNTFVFAP